MIVWMLYSALVALIVAAAARAAEWLARLVGYRVRFIWVGAVALTAILSASPAWRITKPADVPTAESPITDIDNAALLRTDASSRRAVHRQGVASAPIAPTALRFRIETLRGSLDAPWRLAAARIGRAVSPAANILAASLAAVITFGLLIVLAAVARRFRIARREWPRVAIQGVEVRVAPHIGPLVIGFVRPEIVVPRWLLARRADEQGMVVTHEAEHVRARDPFLLAFAWCAVIVAPWNPALWYMLSRLRLAVELDCDARVLRRGAAPLSYGSLLIDVAQQASALQLNALALADDSSQLRQRILAMKPMIPRFARLRAGVAGVFAITAVLVACQSTLPIGAEIARSAVAPIPPTPRSMTELANANQRVATIPPLRAQSIVQSSTTAAPPRAPTSAPMGATIAPALAPAGITTPAQSGPTVPSEVIHEWIRRYHPNVYTGESHVNSVTIVVDANNQYVGSVTDSLSREPTAGIDSVWARMAIFVVEHQRGPNDKTRPVYIVDGVRVNTLDSLDGNVIRDVQLVSGAAATSTYGPDASNGAIVVTTKPEDPDRFMKWVMGSQAKRLTDLGVTRKSFDNIMMIRSRPGVVGPNTMYITVLQRNDGKF